VVIKFRINRILIPIVIDLFIIIVVVVVVVVVMPLMLVVFSCHKVIDMPQQSSKVVVDRATDASIVPSLVSVASCVASNTPILSFVTYTSASIPYACFFTSHTKA
jgi:hypothetical protein